MADYSPRDRFFEIMLSKVADDRYPSPTQLSLIERMLDREQRGLYLEVLMEKIEADRFPSIPLMHRVEMMLQKMG